MSTSRAESQTPQFGRRRSNTTQSVYKSVPASAAPLKVGDSKTLITWVHEPKESSTVILNPAYWPGVEEGDMLRLSSSSGDNASGFLFSVEKHEGFKHQLQVSVPRPVADKFSIRNNTEVILTKIDKDQYSADYIELTFQEQYLGRNEMWRLASYLVGQCVYVEQDISFIGVIAAKVHAISVEGKEVSAAYITTSTKAIYRSLSAKVTIFIQVCRELWEFAGDGERYNEKIVHSYLPALFTRWRQSNVNHIVTIVLISRVFYDDSEVDEAAGPLRQDEEWRWYKDFFKVITDLEILNDWKSTLVDLKTSFWEFQRDILLAHHYHRSTAASQSWAEPDHVRLVGQLSYAHDGPLLEALNLGLNPTETHYIDRSLSLTGTSTIVITPGTGYFRVSKQLLRLTTTRVLDQGFGVELVSLTKSPLHQSPIFSFLAAKPDLRLDAAGKTGFRYLDPLLGATVLCGEDSGQQKTKFFWEPFWMTASFWDKQMDLPFREDRFVARAKMHEIEMLGLLDHDVLSNIEIAFLPELPNIQSSHDLETTTSACISQEEADAFDMNVFSVRSNREPTVVTNRTSTSSGASLAASASLHLSSNIKHSSSKRASASSMVPSGEQEQDRATGEQSTNTSSYDADHQFLSATAGMLSTSPSQSSMHSVRSTGSHKSLVSVRSSDSRRSRLPKQPTSEKPPAMKSRLTPSWLFNPFRSEPSQPQMSAVSVSSVTTPISATVQTSLRPSSSDTSNSPTSTSTSSSLYPQQKSAQFNLSSRGPFGRDREAESRGALRGPLGRRSPHGTPPREDSVVARRRTLSKVATTTLPNATPLPALRTNPSKPLSSVPYTQASLARRWQHIFPRPLSKHEIKWKAMVMPGCLPLTTQQFPTASELETTYELSSYDFVIDPPEMRSFLVKPPSVARSPEDIRRAWALVVLRGMVALRLAQGFQIVLAPSRSSGGGTGMPVPFERNLSYTLEEENMPKPVGVAQVLKTPDNPVYLSMSNEIHCIAFTGDTIQVRRYVRRTHKIIPIEYKCLIWPKLGVGYTELATSFTSHGLESYGWNRLDMLVAGYENQFHDSLRYWRTRFVVIPTDEPPTTNFGPSGEKLDDEEVRLMGMDKLAELFSKARWCPPDERGKPTPVRFLTTDLEPATCILDESLTARLDEIHAAGPLKKKKNDRDIVEMTLPAIAKAMREEDGVPIKEHKWHGMKYPNSFTGSDLVSWMIREFRDVSSREQGVEWGIKLKEKGLFDHCRGAHGFLDGHYFYILRGEYLVPMTPRWFRSSRHVSGEDTYVRSGAQSGSIERMSTSSRRAKKRLILSQSMVIDVDPMKRSDQAESVILHHDIIHNPATCFHFELHWLGTTARCIEELLRQWSRTIDRYGLKLVEAYVSQICDIRDRNPFQSCFPIQLCVPPPIVPDLDKRVPEGVQTRHYFEYAILRKHGFVLDIEAAALYPDQVDVIYSYRRSPFTYSQWVHRSGVAFVQVLGGSQGFLFLTNRLMTPVINRPGTSIKAPRPIPTAEDIRIKLQKFCADKSVMDQFYDEELIQLERVQEQPHLSEDPPPLRI